MIFFFKKGRKERIGWGEGGGVAQIQNANFTLKIGLFCGIKLNRYLLQYRID